MAKLHHLLPLLLAACLCTAAFGFVPPTPAAARAARPKARLAPAALSPVDVADALNSVVLTVADAAADAEYEYGAVAAPGWVLPLGALLTVGFAVAIPALLRPGTEAFEEERERLEDMKQRRNQDE